MMTQQELENQLQLLLAEATLQSRYPSCIGPNPGSPDPTQSDRGRR